MIWPFLPVLFLYWGIFSYVSEAHCTNHCSIGVSSMSPLSDGWSPDCFWEFSSLWSWCISPGGKLKQLLSWQWGPSTISSFALLSSQMAYSSRQHLFSLHFNYSGRFAMLSDAGAFTERRSGVEVGEDNEFSSSFKTIRSWLASTYVVKRGTAYGFRLGPTYCFTLFSSPMNTNHILL